MKKLVAALSLTLVVVLGAIGLSACSSSVTGTYKFKSISYSEELSQGMPVQGMENLIAQIEEEYKNSCYVIQKGGKGYIEYKVAGFTAKQEFVWTKDGNKITMTIPATEEDEEDSVIVATISGKTLTISEDGVTVVYKK